MLDNGPQFDSRSYRNFCLELKTKNLYSTPRYPQSNGQAGASNKTILTALKKRLYSAKGKWVDELPEVLWAYRTTARQPTGISFFALTYRMEAIVSTKIGMPTFRTDLPEQSNVETMIKDLDMADELREAATVRIASYHNSLANLYNRRIKPRMFHHMEAFKSDTQVFHKNTSASLKNLETQVGQLALNMPNQSKGTFPSDTQKNPKDCMAVQLRSGKEVTNNSKKERKEETDAEQEETGKEGEKSIQTE